MKIRVEKPRNFTVMSNCHFFDKRLSYKAKGLLSFMLAVPDSWEFSVKGLAAMAKDGVDSVTAALKELEKNGYVSRRQIRSEGGKFTEVEYTIYEQPIIKNDGGADKGDKNSIVPSKSKKKAEARQMSGTQPVRENPESVKRPKSNTAEKEKSLSKKPNRENPLPVNPISGKPISEKPVSENPAQINTDKSNILTEVNINHINSYREKPEKEGMREEKPDYALYEGVIKDNIGYDSGSVQYSDSDLKQIDFMIQLMAETMISSEDTVRIGKKDLPSNIVKSRFMKIRRENIDAVLFGIKESKAEIKYFKNYLLTALYYSDGTENFREQQRNKHPETAANQPVKPKITNSFNNFEGRSYGAEWFLDFALEGLAKEDEEREQEVFSL